MEIQSLAVLRWLHIVCMVYWLGGEWGVFNSSTYVVDRKLSMEERRRHMQTAYRIDILARSGIILLLPLGLHMGYIWGAQPLGGDWLTGMWVLSLAWWGLCLAAFFYRNSSTGIALTKIDEGIRFFVIPALMLSAIGTLLGYGPFGTAEGQLWYASKVLLYSFALVIGLYLRFRDARMAGEFPGCWHRARIPRSRQRWSVRFGAASPSPICTGSSSCQSPSSAPRNRSDR